MNTPYDVLGVPRSASEEAIKAAFYRTAKACHPDLNAGDPTAEQKLRQAVDAYQFLKDPQRRATYDLQLRSLRRERAGRFVVPVVAGLVSGGVVALAVFLSISRPQVASSGQPLSLASEWLHLEASGDPKAIWSFAVRNPDTPESVLARSKLVGLIDAAEDVPLLQVLRLVASGAVAERARDRLVSLGALAAAETQTAADNPVSDAPSSTSRLQALKVETIQPLPREDLAVPAAQVKTITTARRGEPALQAVKVEIKAARREQPALQAAKVEAIRTVNREEPALQDAVDETIEAASHTAPADHKMTPPIAARRRATSQPALRQASPENRKTSDCSGSCSSSALFGVGF